MQDMMTSSDFQPSYTAMTATFCSVQPQPILSQGFALSSAIGHPSSRSSHCIEPSTIRVRKRSHVCPVRTCGKSFTTSGNLSRHKRLHGKIAPLSCPAAGCICVFPSNNKLEKHLKYHYGGDVKACQVVGCGRTFSTTGNLNRHLKNHHDGMTLPIAAPTSNYSMCRGDDNPVGYGDWSPCTSSSESDLDSSSELCWLSSTTPEANKMLFDSVWNEDLLDALVVMLEGNAETQEC